MAQNNPRGTYTRERVKLTAEHIKKAKSMIALGKLEGRGHEFADTAIPGLVLRVTPQSGTFYLRLREMTLKIADLGILDAMPLADLRDLAQRARLAIRAGKDPRTDLKVFQHAMSKTGDPLMATDAAFPEEIEMMSDEERRRRGPWEWQDLVDEFLKAKKPRLDAEYYPLYERYLQHPAFKRIRHRRVVDLTIDDLEWVRDDIIEANTVSAARRSVQQAKEALSWAWKHQARRSGLGKVEYEWWNRWTVEYRSGTRDHTPTVEELARTLAVAEHYRTLGATEHATSPGTLAMLWAIVLTAQRTYALSQTKASSLVPLGDPERPGWWVLGWEATVMKSRAPHGIPLPPQAEEVLDRILQENLDKGRAPSVWLFPSIRGDGPASANSVNQLLNRLSGIKNGGNKDKDREDLLAKHGIRRWTPHDVRRALSSYLGDRRLGGAASAILDHAMDGRTDERERTATVTRLHYDRAQRMDLKAEGMELWVKAVMDAYGKEKASLAAMTLAA